MTERTQADAAAKAEVAEQTLRRWLASDPAFLAAYRAARRQVMDGWSATAILRRAPALSESLHRL